MTNNTTQSYSQNREDVVVWNYFVKKHIPFGHVLSIGENNGVDLSNAKAFIDMGWSATLVEPSSVFEDMENLHRGNEKVKCIRVAIAKKNGEMNFLESGAHVKGGKDKALVSTLIPGETSRWPDVEFKTTTVECMTFEGFYQEFGDGKYYDFITIDAEGMDFDILKQIDLIRVGCSCLCIEYNSDIHLAAEIKAYCARYGLSEIHRNAENIILAK